MQQIALSSIRTDAGTQSRAALNEEIVAEYAEAIRAGANMPPVTLYHDGKHYFLADGFHRYYAHQNAGAVEIDADVLTGTKRAAILYSVSANFNHGLRRTNEDKRCSVKTLLDDKEWSEWSDREIAKRCHVSNHLVSSLRAPVTGNSPSEKLAERKFTTKHGTQATMRTEAIGRTEKQAPPPAAPTPAADPAKQPQSSDLAANDDHDGQATLSELVDELQSENMCLAALLKTAEADDLVAEAVKWRSAYERSQAAVSEAMDSAASSQKREKFSMAQLRRCGKAVGVEDPRKIAAAVEAMAKGAVPCK